MDGTDTWFYGTVIQLSPIGGVDATANGYQTDTAASFIVGARSQRLHVLGGSTTCGCNVS